MGKKHRRGRGEGSISRHRASGQWMGQLNQLGVRRTVYGATRQEVDQKLLELRTQKRPNDLPLTFALDQWLEVVGSRVGSTTLDRYRTHVNRFIRPALGQVSLGCLKSSDIATFYRGIEASVAGKIKIGKVLRQIFNHFVQIGAIGSNPALLVPLPRVQKEEIRPLDPDQLKTFIQEARKDRLYALYLTALDSGARQGELFALEWTDLLPGGILSVTKSLRDHQGRHDIKGPKTKSGRRRVQLSLSTLQALEEHKERQTLEGHGSSLIFCNTEGGYLRKENLHKRFKAICRASGVPWLRFHDLRHTSASLLMEEGNPKAVAERLGHSNVRTTLDIYSHSLPIHQQALASRMDKILTECSNKAVVNEQVNNSKSLS